MNLDELQSVQARERQSSDLQHLRSSFYREVGEYIRELTEKRARLVEEADDPFSSPEVRRLSDDIETAEGTVEAIYERRVGKVVKKASIAAAGMPVDDDGLTEEEESLFEDLVERIEQNRETVLSAMDGEGPSVSCSIDGEPAVSADPEPTEPGDADREAGVNAADLMGDGSDDGGERTVEDPTGTAEPPASQAEPQRPEETATVETDPLAAESPSPAGETTDSDRPVPDDVAASTAGQEATRTAEESTGGEVPGMPRTTVRITAEVGEVVGADDRDYELGAEDVVTLPEPNADVLVDKDAAERLE